MSLAFCFTRFDIVPYVGYDVCSKKTYREGIDNMGTRSVVRFKDSEGKAVLSIYQQYDGYLEGVGVQVAETLKRWVVDGVEEIHTNSFTGKETRNVRHANGLLDLALLYVKDNKMGAYDMYVTDEKDSQEFNYEIGYAFNTYYVNVYELTYSVSEADNPYHRRIFTGTYTDFIAHIERVTGK